MKRRVDLWPMPDPSRRRLLYVQPCSSFGGAERQASLNVPRLRESGFDVLPLVGPSQTIVRWLNDNGVDELVHTHEFPGGGPKLQGWSRARIPFVYVRAVHRIAEQIEALVRERRIDAILAALPFSWVAATPVARRLGVPIIWRAGGTEISTAEKMILAAWAAVSPPDLLVCCGQAVHDRFARLVDAPAVVINNGVDTEGFHPGVGDARLYRPEGARLVVGFAARLVPQKRPEDFLRMAAEIAPYHRDVRFLVAGEGSRRPLYEAMAEISPAAEQVRFLGYVEDMRSFYAACDILVLPSRSEGCPNVVLEAMAMRRALVVSERPARATSSPTSARRWCSPSATSRHSRPPCAGWSSSPRCGTIFRSARTSGSKARSARTPARASWPRACMRLPTANRRRGPRRGRAQWREARTAWRASRRGSDRRGCPRGWQETNSGDLAP